MPDTPRIKGKAVTFGQKAVYDVLRQYGPVPDHALVPLAQHVASVHQSSSSIRSRRAELTRKGLVVHVSDATTASGRHAGVFKAVR